MFKSLRIQILGRDYTLKVHEDNRDQTQQLADYVDHKMSVFRKAHPDQSDTTAAVMTSLAIAEELFLERATQEEVRESLDLQLGELERQLTESLTTKG
ncbi:MAG: cell division protein ZapA [Rhodothermales bacterium]|jgi:cell division protein ZapA